MELTRECIEIYANAHVDAEIRSMAKQLLAELDQPNVWTDAPEWATKAVINWSAKTHYSGVYKEYTRSLPKSRIDEIAEEAASKQIFVDGVAQLPYHSLEELIKSAILQARKEWEAER